MRDDEIFVDLAPPQGGLAGLQARLDRPGSPRWTWVALPMVAVAVALVALQAAGFAEEAPPSWSHDPVFATSTTHGVSLADAARSTTALQEVPTEVPGVVMVRVASR